MGHTHPISEHASATATAIATATATTTTSSDRFAFPFFHECPQVDESSEGPWLLAERHGGDGNDGCVRVSAPQRASARRRQRPGEWVRGALHGEVPEAPTPQEPGTQHFNLGGDGVPELGARGLTVSPTSGRRSESRGSSWSRSSIPYPLLPSPGAADGGTVGASAGV